MTAAAAELRLLIAGERRGARAAAKAFAAACTAGDAAAFFEAVDLLNINAPWYGWRWAMMRTAKLSIVNADIRSAFLNVWIESKALPLRVGDRRALARALRIFMPSDYRGAPIKLYRGTDWEERRRRRYGFSWTRHEAMAQEFAEGCRLASQAFKASGAVQIGGGVVLGTLAPAEAILLIRDEENYYDEGEIVLDPFKLPSVSVVERLRS